MFGLLHNEFVQGSAIRTWNCVAHFANLLWYKFHHLRDPIMPRSRRRHHSRSRSRSRSHSHERDREVKRRKIDDGHKRTVSSQPEANNSENEIEILDKVTDIECSATLSDTNFKFQSEEDSKVLSHEKEEIVEEKHENQTAVINEKSDISNCSENTSTSDVESNAKQIEENIEKKINSNADKKHDDFIDKPNLEEISDSADKKSNTVNYNCQVVLLKMDMKDKAGLDDDETIESDDDGVDIKSKSPVKSHSRGLDLQITPKKTGSPKHMLKKIESEKKRLEKQKEKEERQMKRQKEKEEREMKKQKEKEEKSRALEEKMKQKQEKDEQKLKEKMEKQEQRQREKEIIEQKRREKEEKDEQKRKEREQEKLKRQQEIDEKNKEKQKIEKQKQKAAALFVNFFVTKKGTDITDDKKTDTTSNTLKFMPFEIKSEMRLAPVTRRQFNNESKAALDEVLQNQNGKFLYLDEIKQGKTIVKTTKTWPLEDSTDDVLVIEENTLGETIVEQKPKLEKMRAKFLKFHENQRPPYFGTWRKRSKFIRSKNPFGQDKTVFDYEVDSDDEWEDEGEGESLKGSDEDEKENDSENEYEVDNEFFVPHGHLSDDEVDDEENAKLSPESHKAKLKLLKNEFDEEMKSKTQKIKPRVIGCIWYNKAQDNVEDAIHRYLLPFSIISNGQIQIQKRSNILSSTQKKSVKKLEREHIPLLLKLIHGNVRKRKMLINEFLEFLSNNGIQVDVSKIALGRQIKELAHWMKCPDQGSMYNKMCWYVGENVRKEFNVNLSLPNKWESMSKKEAILE